MTRAGRGRPRRTGLRAWLSAVGVLLLLLGGYTAVRLRTAQTELQAARSQLAEARAAIEQQRLPDAAQRIAASARATRSARAATDDPLWRVLGSLPAVGETARSISDITRAADDLARSVLPEVLAAATELDASSLRDDTGRVQVARLQAAEPKVARAAARAEAVRATLARRPRVPVPLPVRRAREDLAVQAVALAQTLRAADEALLLAPALLGTDRPRRFFVLVQQPAESRGTGGLPGGYAVLTAESGRLSVTAQGSNADLISGRVPVPAGVGRDYVQSYEPNGAFDLWANVNLSPDLPTVARVVAERWRAQGGPVLDGVVALDATALSLLLAGGPPLDVGGRSVTAEGLPALLAVEQYRGAPADVGRQQQRKDQLADVAAVAARRVASGEVSTLPLLRGLAAAVRSGHLRMASDDPALRTGLHRSGVDGGLPEGPAPVAFPVVNNATGSKLDTFLERRLVHRRGACVDGRRRTEVTVALTNTAPAKGLPPYVTLRFRDGEVTQSVDSAVLLTVYATRGAVLLGATLDDAPLAAGAEPVYATEHGLPSWTSVLELPRGATRTLVLELDEPAARGALRVPRQPLARDLQVAASAVDCSD